MKILLSCLKPYRFRMLKGLSIKIAGTVVELFIPYLLTYILETVVLKNNAWLVVLYGVLMVLCALLACIFNIVANRMAAGVSREYAEHIRHKLFSKTLSLSSAQTDKFTVASLESRITNDTYNIHHFVGMIQRMGVRAPILLIGGVLITMIMDLTLSLIMLTVMPFAFGLIYFISRKGIPLYSKVQKSVDGMTRVVREDSSGIRVIKALSKENFEHGRYDFVNKKLVEDEKRAGIIMGALHPVMNLFMNMGIVAVIAVAAGRVTNRLSTPETVIAFIQYFTQISMSMMALSRMFTMSTKSIASAKRIEEVLEAEEELLPQSREDYKDNGNDSIIEFKNVSFSYNGKADDLSNISFKINPGESLGIIGATGSGKSTIIKLMLRFYDVSGGAVYINGRDIRTYKKQELYSIFGTAMQNDFFYAGTIMENIKFGRDISDTVVIEAAKVAMAHEFIIGFDEGYDRLLSQKATNISGGQKQRLLIARAIAAKPKIIVLDDSTSALDYRTEAELRKNLNKCMKNTTVVTVAQRISTVKNCDLILVVDDGKIIGSGKHEYLYKTCNEYSAMYDSQMGGAIVD